MSIYVILKNFGFLKFPCDNSMKVLKAKLMRVFALQAMGTK